MHEPKYDPSYYADEQERTRLTKFAAIAVLALEMILATLAIISFDGQVECCDDHWLYDSEKGQDTWDKIFLWVSVGYLSWAVLSIVFVAVKEYHVALLNPLIGFTLAYFTLYNAQRWEALTMYGLETAAMLLESFVLVRDQKYSLLGLQMLVVYVASGIGLYCIMAVSKDGGYCIVDGTLQSVFQNSTCNMDCDDVDIPCFVCNVVDEPSSCFIPF
jgi:hypothetical protein